MKITLQREKSTEQSTPGKLYIDAPSSYPPSLMRLCYTLEDVVRDVKIKGVTAIPAGRYKLAYTLSARFNKATLQLLDVPNFTGVRIHGGNDSGDTEGCPLLGMVRVSPDRIRDCAPAVAALQDRVCPLLARGEEVWMDVVAAQEQTMGFGIADE